MILIQTAQFDQPYSIDISKESKVSVWDVSHNKFLQISQLS